MKLSINKNLRVVLIVFLILTTGGVSFLVYKEVKQPGFEEQRIPIYSYNNKATVGYRVYFKPNELYDSESMGEDQIYLTEFVDYIKANFKYEFTGDKAVNLKGTYNITARVQGYTTDINDNVINIWEKDFIIVPQKNFTINRKTMFVDESVDINLGEYNAFVARIIEASKVVSQTRLNLIMNINLEGDTSVGKIEETITPSLIIPLNSPTIQITGNREIKQPGAIEETKQIQLPVNRRQIIIYGVIIGVLVLALGYIGFFTESMVDKDPFEKELRKLFKKHGDRFVALNSEIATTDENITLVKSMDDLVRIADELIKPIMYKYSYDYRDINKFYVVDEDKIYMLDLSSLMMKKEPKKAVVVSKR